MRIITRPDFDGIVCAVLLHEALDIQGPVKWVQPSEIQEGVVTIQKGDVVANLPYAENASLWFDHHVTNRIEHPFEGAFRIVPSAAGIIFEYYRNHFAKDYTELVRATDKIDSADLSLDQILHPQNHPYILLSMTITVGAPQEEAYWNHLVALLRSTDIHAILEDGKVSRRCRRVVETNRIYHKQLLRYTRMQGPVSITDFRKLDPAPSGNRFLVYSLFPKALVNLKIYHEDKNVVIKLGHSIIKRGCKVNVGKLLSNFEGGGHRGAGACRFPIAKTDQYLPKIMAVLQCNEDND
jgi:hypothetical protein